MENRDLELGGIENMENTLVDLFLDRVKEEHNLNEQITPSIHMAPRTLRVRCPQSFKPRVVSIGPLHRDNKIVKAFERQKATYQTNLMNSCMDYHITSSPEIIMNSCMEKVYASMEKIKACYVLTKTYTDVEFAEMMVMDACFILGFIHQTFELKSVDMFHAEDVVCDLVLLENQIPFFFLEEIFKCTIAKLKPNTSIVQFMHPVLSILNLFNSDLDLNILKNISIDDTHHILSLLHECYRPQKNKIIRKEFSITKPHYAVDLDKAGVSFKPNRSKTWVLGMEMEFPCFLWSLCNCTLRMPVFVVKDLTEVTLRNLIAYEQESSQTHNYVTSYAFVISMLVNTQDDVAKLVDSEVLVNEMGTNEVIAKMINNICKEVALNPLHRQTWIRLDKYYNSYWPNYRRTYFSSPWNIINLIFGSIIFALTIVQTIFTIRAVK